MNQMTSTTFRIIGFHNCDGCTQKVTTALRRFIGLRLVEFDRETGKLTVSTTEHPEVIRYALERQIKKPVVIVPMNQTPNSVASSIVPAQRSTIDLQALGEVVLGMCQVLDSVEITHSNVYRVSFNHREKPPVVRPEPRGGVHIQDAEVEHAPRRVTLRAPPWPVAEPSAPLIKSEVEEEVYGYPPKFYGYSATGNYHDPPNGCCTIM